MNVRRPIPWPTALRWGLGRLYFSGRRFLAWHFSGRSFCSQFSGEALPCLYASHESPFWRPLKNVDAYLQENKIFRHVTDLASGEIFEEFITANNALMMYNPLLTGGEK